MNKKFKNLFLAGAIVLGLAGVAVSCTDYDGDINDLTERVKKLESTVSDLQTAINNGAVITDVTPITNGVKVTLSNGKSFDVTNGKDGNDGAPGAPGKDGSVVTIGANGNWFIDGKDTGFASKGDKGERVILVRTATTAHLALLVRTALTARMPFRSGISLAPTRVTPTTASGLSTPMILPPRRQLLRSRTSMCSLREP